MSGARIFNAAVNSFRTSQANLLAISGARQKLEKEKERLDYEKRKNDVELEGLKLNNSMKKSEIEFEKATRTGRLKLFEEALGGQEAMIDLEEDKQKSIAEQSMGVAKTVVMNDPYVLAPYVTGKGQIGVRPMKKGSASSISEKDVLAEARAMAKESTDPEDMDLPYVERMNKYIPVARKMLRGESSSEGVGSVVPTKKEKQFDAKTESVINANMKAYGKSREEVIAALKKKNKI